MNWKRIARGLAFLSPLAIPIALLTVKTDGNFLVLFLAAYGLPYLLLKPLTQSPNAFTALFTTGVVLQTIVLAWWVGGAATRIRAALRAAVVAVVVGAAYIAYVLLLVTAAAAAGL